jgi:hypothetical protein
VPRVSATVLALGNRFDGDASARITFKTARRDLPGRKPFRFDGAGSVLADLTIRDGQLDESSSLEVPRVSATVLALGNRFDGDASARITFKTARRDLLEPQLEATMQQFRIAPASEPDRPYVLGQNLHIDAFASGDPRRLNEKVQAHVRFQDARIPDLKVYNRYLPTTNLRFDGGEGRLSGDLRFDREGGVGSGELQVTSRNVRLALADLALQGEIAVDTHLRRAELATHRFVVDGSRLVLKNMQVTSGEESLGSGWWGEIVLDQARLDWGKPFTLDGQMSVKMKDVGVLLAIYARKKELPGWVSRLVDRGEAVAEGRVQWRNKTLLLDPLAAHNDRFDVLARLRLREKQATGDLLAHWGAMTLGVELVPGKKKDMHVVNARKWYDSQPALASR